SPANSRNWFIVPPKNKTDGDVISPVMVPPSYDSNHVASALMPPYTVLPRSRGRKVVLLRGRAQLAS
ncbi:MAG: hypothetical protein LBL27_03530, partial [Coriobacteriales bacterium]|nr:hypothetical protein [Coriobacteriales bacterium]